VGSRVSEDDRRGDGSVGTETGRDKNKWWQRSTKVEAHEPAGGVGWLGCGCE
jgi:hypothetical protein